MLVIVIIALVVVHVDVYAVHLQVSLPCNVHIQHQTVPVMYGGGPRNNPDGTFYPGDSFYYLVWFSASPTCLGLSTSALKSYDGLDVDYHKIILWNGKSKDISGLSDTFLENSGVAVANHTHEELSPDVKHLRTTHYSTSDGKHLMSVREDQSLTERQKKTLDRIARYDLYVRDYTWEWDYTYNTIPHSYHLEPCDVKDLADGTAVKDTYRNTALYHNGKKCQVEDMYVDPDSLHLLEDLLEVRCTKLEKYSGCIFGKAAINGYSGMERCLYDDLDKMDVAKSEYPDSDKCIHLTQKIEQKITGIKKVCNSIDGNIVCKGVPVPKTATIKPDVLMPDLNLVLDHVILPDMDGYDARNLDGTYYVWDPITITHVPEFKWKNYRENTIHFDLHTNSTLLQEQLVQCGHNLCDVMLEHPGTSPTRWNLGNGDGIAIYNATNYSYLGLHDFEYGVTVHNNELLLDSDEDTTDGLVVTYEPQYSGYPYSLLADDMRTSYENRAAISLHYMGSVGGGPDDMGGLHELRRSKINDYTYSGMGFDPWDPVQFDDVLNWSKAYDAGITPGVVSDISCDIRGTGTAMAVRAGYCKIYFEYPIIHTITGKTGPIYENITLLNELASENFAGRNTTLIQYEYAFPEPLFHTVLLVESLGADGMINPIPLRVQVMPAIAENQAYSLPEYLYEKVLHDSEDSGLATIVANDTYPVEYEKSGMGSVDVKLRRTSAEFKVYQGDGAEMELAGLDIRDLAPIYLENSYNARLEVPINVGLGSLSPVSVIVQVDDKTRHYTYDYVDYGEDHKIVVNVAQDNSLEISRYDGIVNITPPEHFGDITALYINDIQVDIQCNDGCSINTPSNDMISITAENDWGGKAHAVAQEFVPPNEHETGYIATSNLAVLVPFVLSLPLLYWVYHKVKNRK